MTIRFRDPELTRTWEQRGFVIVPLLDHREVDGLRAGCVPASDIAGYPFSATIMSRDVAERRRISDGLRALLQPKVDGLLKNYRVCFGNYAFKPGGQTAGTVELHQDWSFVDENDGEPLGVWCPLVDVTPENGCLFVVPGSHRLTRQPRSVFERFDHPEIADLIDDVLMPLPMQAGEAVFFSQRLFHTSPPNRSAAPRPVACAVLAPDGNRYRCYYPDAAAPNRLLVFDVDDDFYTTYVVGSRPEGQPIGAVEIVPETLSRQELLAVGRQAGDEAGERPAVRVQFPR